MNITTIIYVVGVQNYFINEECKTKGGEHLLNKFSFHYLIICDDICVSEAY
mgnify:CR=1 FL=1